MWNRIGELGVLYVMLAALIVAVFAGWVATTTGGVHVHTQVISPRRYYVAQVTTKPVATGVEVRLLVKSNPPGRTWLDVYLDERDLPSDIGLDTYQPEWQSETEFLLWKARPDGKPWLRVKYDGYLYRGEFLHNIWVVEQIK